MNYLMLTLFGISMASGQPHEVRGTMVDLDTGEVLLVFPEKKKLIDLNAAILDVWGKEKDFGTGPASITGSSMSNVKTFEGVANQSQKDSISCSSDGSCDGGVSLEKSTNNNY
tara:strand:+ start:192 stop:530 length:339 start_codon:yes stop_codon:yes gene_type:complete